MSGPHDLFVRFTFGQPERAAAELRVALPPHVVSQVDWASLRREPSSVVDPELRETESDLLFSARLISGRPLLFYVLLEHQSSVDRWMALRMLRYVVRQLEHWRKEHPDSERLPVIIPLVLYHAPGGAWTAPRRVEELFDLPNKGESPERWNGLVPRFEYLLDDLTAEREESLMARPGPPFVRLALLVLVYARTEELARRLPGWAELLQQIQANPQGFEDLPVISHYLLRVGARSAWGVMVSMLRAAVGAQRTEEPMTTLAEEYFEKWRQRVRLEAQAQGRAVDQNEELAEDLAKGFAETLAQVQALGLAKGQAEGLAKGQAEGKADSILRILAAKDVYVADKSRQRIMSCTDMATLDRWFDQALKATRLSDVLGDLAQ